jgi:superfamily II DNA or RNA helicase
VSEKQKFFDEFFRGQTFTPADGFELRKWQTEFAEDYRSSVDAWLKGSDAQHRFCLYAGPGSGKTKAAAVAACLHLNRKRTEQVILVCPNRSICRKARHDFRAFFGIDLVFFHARKHRDGVPRTKQGYILTYQHLHRDPDLHRRICGQDSLVIFDEVHHLGDGNGWGAAAEEAFGRVRFVLCLTGTPYRSDNTLIPFVRYEEAPTNGIFRFRPDYTYSLGRAVAEGVCRKPLFAFHRGTVKIRTNPNGGYSVVSFDDTEVSDAVAALRLRGAVEYASPLRATMLREALGRCRAEGRKVAVFLGGDTEGDHTPTEDATTYLPDQLRAMGISDDEFDVVTGDDADSQAKIERFGASGKWILVSINMVSEGTDIPEISAAIFLTTITAKQTTIQRIGRALRRMGPDDPHETALAFMFADPGLIALDRDIASEVEQEIDLARKRAAAEERAGRGDGPRYRAEAIGVEGGEIQYVVFGGRKWSAEVFEQTRRWLRERGLPDTFLGAALSLMRSEPDERLSA